MTTVVAIIVYDRLPNLHRWLDAWDMCEKHNTELVVIHNHDHINHRIAYKKACEEHGVRYFPRQNVGFDIGAFRDVCQGKIRNFPDFDQLLWITDDTIPMRRDFVQHFRLQPGHGIKCMEISAKNAPIHVRTTGFSIAKTTCDRLVFPEPLITKEHCYHFEHRGGAKTLMMQVQRMGLKCTMICDPMQSPLWDTGNRSYWLRMDEFKKAFGKPVEIPAGATGGSHVTVICPIYEQYPEIIGSMLNQTHKNWTLRLVHDGPNTTGVARFVKFINDPRIVYEETIERGGNWGHYIRATELQLLDKTDYVVITNADNHHVPVYLERLLLGFNLPNTVATYCSDMIHSYKAWQVIQCKLVRGYVDCAGVMVRAEVAKEVGWRDTESHSSDWTYFEDIIKLHGVQKFRKVIGCLLIHN